MFEHVWKTTVEIYFEMARSEAWDRLRAGEEKEVMNVPELMSKVGRGSVAMVLEGQAD